MNRPPLKTKEEILAEVCKLGKSLAHNANPQTYSLERKYQAKSYEPKLNALRKAYTAINKGGNAAEELIHCRTIFRTGIELNFLNRIIDQIKAGSH